jgi:hypothetical protein
MSKNKSKNSNKEIRQEVGDQTHVNKMTDAEKVRVAIGKQSRLDASQYLRDPENEGYTLFWCSTENGEVDKWLGLGAEPVRAKSKAAKVYKGLNDNIASEYACVPGVGVDEAGNAVTNYLLKLPEEEYEKLRIQPKLSRNHAILEALGVGRIEEESKTMPQVKGLKTYAPNLPDGGKGLSQEQEQVHEV